MSICHKMGCVVCENENDFETSIYIGAVFDRFERALSPYYTKLLFPQPPNRYRNEMSKRGICVFLFK